MTYEEYPPDPYRPSRPGIRQIAYLVDIDGTVADHSESGRGHYEYDRVGEDRPIWDTIRVIAALHRSRFRIIFVSGREASCRSLTENWLLDYIPCFWHTDDFELYMRSTGDRRPDTIVKRELFDRHIRPREDLRVVGVFDDRNRVVKMWREQLGLTVFHVADHDF